MPRKYFILACVIVALHIGIALTLGTSTLGSFLANTLQNFACGFAVVMAIAAYRRGRGLSRPFWMLFAIGIAMWGIANFGWMYYETVLHREPPTGSVVRFLFGLQSIPFAMALFLDQEKDSPRLDVESVLDFIQIAIVFFFIFVGFYYLPAHHLNEHDALMREIRVETGEDVLLMVLAAIQAMRARVPHVRHLFAGLSLYVLVYTVSAALADYAQSLIQTPTGTFFDLAWTLPLLGAALWAAQWQPTEAEQRPPRVQRKNFSHLILTNVNLAVAPLIILLQVSQLGSEWRVVRFSLLAVSIVCYAARLGISQFREARSADAVHTHTLAMESAINGMAILDAKGQYIYVNPSYARMIGYANPELLLGKRWDEISDPGDVAPVEASIRNGLKKHGKWFGPITAHHSDGTVVPMETSITALPDGGTVCVTHDISQRLSAQRARTEAEIKYRTIIEQVAAISYIAELGLNGQWFYVSPQIEGILGYAPEEWLADSRDWVRHIPPEDRHVVEAAEEASKLGKPFQAEYRMTCKDGKVIWVSDNAVVVRGSDSHPVMEGLIVDITDRKLLENQLQQSRRMEAVGRLAGGIAHDFNNLLTIIKGYAEMALNRPSVPPELTADVQQIGNAADRASNLIRQLLAFSRKQVLQPKPLDLNAIVEGLDKLLNRLMGADIQMKTACGANIGTVKADPAQIEQVIMNLVVNARDAMPSGGRLTIETANVHLDANYARDHVSVKPGPYVMLAVSDTGMGMDSETQAHIFEPFYTTKGGGRGTGLGLSTVYGIIKQSGGYIWVYSEPGKGTTFKVYLPRVEEPVEEPAGKTDRGADRKGNETILLVEDEEAVRELTRTILAAQGYSVLVAESAANAEQIAANASPEIQLLLTDVVMPEVSGRELARRITTRNARMQVLFMSGYTDNVITHEGVLETGVAFLQKPFTPRALTNKVREVLDRTLAAKR
jgi:PAS domain S-box-containing protein